MNNTFLNKVQAERGVLKEVNRYTSGAGQLAGLSGAAIDSWLGRHSNVVTKAEVAIHLRRLAAFCQTLSDRSHETFSEFGSAPSDSFVADFLALQESLELAFKGL